MRETALVFSFWRVMYCTHKRAPGTERLLLDRDVTPKIHSFLFCGGAHLSSLGRCRGSIFAATVPARGEFAVDTGTETTQSRNKGP